MAYVSAAALPRHVSTSVSGSSRRCLRGGLTWSMQGVRSSLALMWRCLVSTPSASVATCCTLAQSRRLKRARAIEDRVLSSTSPLPLRWPGVGGVSFAGSCQKKVHREKLEWYKDVYTSIVV